MSNTDKPRRPLLDFDEARQRLMAHARPITQTETVPLLQAVNRVLAQSVQSPMNVPGFDNSSMDGYAICPEEATASPMRLTVTQRIAAGMCGMPLQPGQAARIFTGAPVPRGTYAVIPQENVQVLSETEIETHVTCAQGDFIRKRGEDISQESEILAAGTLIHPAHLALAASVGITELVVARPLKIALLLTGDELVEPGQPLGNGQIYNSNRYWLQTLLTQLGCEVLDPGIVPDTAISTQRALQAASHEADVIITCGGVSVGEEDHVRAAVESMGQIDLWQIGMKPGKPLAYGKVHDTDILGLPGNPVSAYVTFLLMGLPFLRARLGQAAQPLAHQPMIAGFDWPRADSRREFIRVRRRTVSPGVVVLERWPNQSSGVMSSVAWADGLVDIPAGHCFSAGDTVAYLPMADLIALSS
ncbi:gephyrin-like molybdotransferase Glp [Orrella sp. 11846]|uniref:molybdopterin molybdotransferase MoeA n=1 Tax=Orrella sp. 11846 TaxID=3409913 RepID=UPI003B5A3C47